NSLGRQLTVSDTPLLHEPEDFCRMRGRYGEFGFGCPHRVTGYQSVLDWVNVGKNTLSILKPMPFAVEEPPFLFRRLGEIFHVRWHENGHYEEGTSPVC